MSLKNIIIILMLVTAGYVYVKYLGEKPNHLIASLNITSDKTGKNLEFAFVNPIRYLGHFPEDASDILQIKIRSIGFHEFNENFSLVGNIVDSTVVREGQIKDIRYEGDVPGGPFIVVRFVNPVETKISESNGLKGLIVNYKAI